jgi:quercetin dioxygenase-like cupin family protein
MSVLDDFSPDARPPARPASVIVPPASAPPLDVLGETVAIRLSALATRAACTVLEIGSPVGGGISVLHTHPGAEVVVVLAGTYEFYGQHREATYALAAPAGSVVHVPDGAPHGYANVGPTPGRLLVVLDAAGRMDAFVEAVGTPADAAPPFPDVARWLQALAEYRVTFVEVPPAAEAASK